MALFPKQTLIDMVWFVNGDDFHVISNELVGSSRWSLIHKMVFEHDGKFYVTTYRTGATEQQDESPYEYDPDMIECAEVFPKEKTITIYE